MAGRSARSEEVKIENMFFDLSPERQEPLLRMLQRLHELKLRQVEPPKADATPITESAAAP